jgi:hypothetical protein
MTTPTPTTPTGQTLAALYAAALAQPDPVIRANAVQRVLDSALKHGISLSALTTEQANVSKN